MVRRAGHASERRAREQSRHQAQPPEQQQQPEQAQPIFEQPMFEQRSPIDSPMTDADQPDHEQYPPPPPFRLLPLFAEHRAASLLRGQDCGTVKFSSHGSKIIGLRPKQQHPTIQRYLQHAGLLHLDWTPLGQVNQQLLSAFLERWHPETSSFHMPWGEMTITLDDVSVLLHLPITGNVISEPLHMTPEEAMQAGLTYLGIPRQASFIEFRGRTPAYRFRFLEDWFRHHFSAGQMDFAVRCYVLHLLGGTILADKSHESVPVRYIHLISDQERIGSWAWGQAALVTLYDHLNYSSYATNPQCAGYASLLQCWIYEHFPTIVDRDTRAHTDRPRASRWKNKKLDRIKLADFRRRIDNLQLDDVVFQPYEDHRIIRPFNTMAYFRGWLLWGDTAVKYMADRVRWQFGYRQDIPVAPLPDPRPSTFDILQGIAHSLGPATRFLRRYTPTDLPYQLGPGYLEWYLTESVPRLTPEAAAPEVEVEVEAEAEPEDARTQAQIIDDISDRILDVIGGQHVDAEGYDYLLECLGDLSLIGP